MNAEGGCSREGNEGTYVATESLSPFNGFHCAEWRVRAVRKADAASRCHILIRICQKVVMNYEASAPMLS